MTFAKLADITPVYMKKDSTIVKYYRSDCILPSV